jgi:acetylornithine deacetylase
MQVVAKDRVSAAVAGLAHELDQFLTDYLRHPSTNPDLSAGRDFGQEAACQQWLASELEQWDTFDDIDVWESAEGRPNLAGIVRGSGGGRALLLNGHSDVVPVGDLATWTVDPWGGEHQGGRIYGRGATDMKGGNVAFLFALRALQLAGIKLKGDVFATVVVGEESGNRSIGPDSVLERGYRAPLCIVAEPTDLTIAAAVSGEVYCKVIVEGRATHLANRPESVWPSASAPPGINAIEKMLKILRALIELEQDWGIHIRHPAMPPGRMTLNISTISGGTFISALPASCEAVFSVLFAPSFTVASMVEEITAVIQRAAQNDLWLREHPPVIECPHVVQGKEPIDMTGHDGTGVLHRAFRSALGRDGESRYASFTSDANYFVDRGQPTLVFGPGDLAMGTHGPNEYIPVSDVADAAKVFGHHMIEWCGVNGIAD